MKYQVYKVQNRITKKVYIGITVKGYRSRFKKHLSEALYGSTNIFHNAIRSYGKEAFELSLLETVDSQEELLEREKFWIAAFDSTDRDKGYNMTLGGEGTWGRLYSQETCKKISDKALGRKSHRALTISILNVSTKKVVIYYSICEASISLGYSQTTLSWYKSKYGNSFILKDLYQITISHDYKPKQKPKKIISSEEREVLMKNTRLGQKKWFMENKEEWSKQIRELSSKLQKPIEQWSRDGLTFIKEYPSIRYAAEATGALKANIRNCAKGKVQSAKGFTWKYPTSI